MEMKNTAKGTVVADQILVANTFLKRLQGLLGKAPLTIGRGLVIRPCNSVHTFGMGYSIDVLFVDDRHRIIRIIAAMPPRRLAAALGSSYVVELAAGGAKEADCSVGDKLEW
jgi:uncharacterized membrane protein (UPF0127 family)